MKLISLNVALFEKNNEKISKFLKQQNADILVLQEVTKGIDDSTDIDLVSKNTVDNSSKDLESSFFAPVWVLSKFEKNNFHGHEHFSFELGGKAEFGNYLKTKFEITKGQSVFVQNHFTYVTDWSKWPEEDYRAVQVVDLNIQGKQLRVLNYHGIWSKDKQGTEKTKKACERIKEMALEVEHPSIICGDFNLFPNTESMNIFDREFTSLVDKYEIKTTRPESNELNNKKRNVVDYILVSKEIVVNNFEVVDTNVSDHLPLIVDFDL